MFRIVIILFFLTGAATIFFIKVQPVFNETRNLKEQIAAFDNALGSARKTREIRDALVVKYNNITQNDIDRLNKLIPSQPATVKFIIETDDIIKKNNMILKSIDVKTASAAEIAPRSKNKPKPFEIASFTMKMTGSYESFFSFLKNMEENLRLTEINSIKLAPAIIAKNLYEFDVEASAYWKPDGELQQNEK